MKCPYCASEIDNAALVCPHCTRDLYLFKPLLERIDALASEVDELKARLADVEDGAIVGQPEAEAEHAAEPLSFLACLLWFVLLPLALLLAAHATITVLYDLNTVYLRIVSLLIPMPFGFLAIRRGRAGFGRWAAAGFAMALLAVLGMSSVIAAVDHSPVLPQNLREWREFVEYSGSIGLSFLAGLLLGRIRLWRRRTRIQADRSAAADRLASLISSGKASAEQIQALSDKIKSIANSVSATAATATAAYAGLKDFIGG